jgi:hypothetical protein
MLTVRLYIYVSFFNIRGVFFCDVIVAYVSLLKVVVLAEEKIESVSGAVFLWGGVFVEDSCSGGSFEGYGVVVDMEYCAFSESNDILGIVVVEFFDACFSCFSFVGGFWIWVEIVWVYVKGDKIEGIKTGCIHYGHVVGGFDGFTGDIGAGAGADIWHIFRYFFLNFWEYFGFVELG